MNLVIDCFKLVKGAGKSIGIYNLAHSIVVHLGERLTQEKDTAGKAGAEKRHLIVLGNAHNREDFDVPGVTFVEMKGDPLNKLYCIVWELLLAPLYARRYGADRILFPRGFGPLSCRIGGRGLKDTIIIHDLIPFYYDKHYPGVFNRAENAYIMNRLKASIRHADRVITISEASRRDILEKVPGCEKKIAVIGNGLNDVSYKRAPAPASARDAGKEDYIVAMTSALPHKNAEGILRTYEAYVKGEESPLRLEVIGIADTSPYPELSEEAKKRVSCHKFFADFSQLCRVAAGAKAYLFLSYAEGFGFPPLEAMQLGVPVVCSNRSSLPEVVGDAGLLVDPDDTAAVADALKRITGDGALREQLIQKGYENIRRFSWDSRTDLYWKELFLR